jgi:DNA recombination protein RmuC|tara:strand:+ start:3148 stop:4134 length:987 start_codon:yes stop_codon:yes gene_type:complete
MTLEYFIIIFLFSILFILLFFQFFFSKSNNTERLKFLLERQENLEKSLLELIEKNFGVIDSKFEKSSNENSSNLNQIKERIAIIDRAQQNISGLTENVIDLKNILSNTSQRGRFGEIILENLISDYLPKKNYEFQKTLSNNCRVDCILKTTGSLNNLCIDAKFPRESYEKIINSKNREEKIKNIKLFKSDISNHIFDVKNKYIIPGETSDIALVFIPSEQIYLEIFNIIPDLSKKFYEYKTFLISPTTLWIVLNYMVNIIKDYKISENSQIIYEHLKDLTNEISRLESRVKKMDSHFSSAQNDLNDILITTKKITNKKDRLLKLESKD